MKPAARFIVACVAAIASAAGPARATDDPLIAAVGDLCHAEPAAMQAFVARGVYGPNGPSPVFENVFALKCLGDGAVDDLLAVAPPQSLIDPLLSASLINPDAGPLDWAYDACKRHRPETVCGKIKAKALTLAPPVAGRSSPQAPPQAAAKPATECGQSPCLLFPDSDRRELTREELAGLSAADLRLARNEIFARHGYDFQSEDLRNHFAGFSWYVPQGRDIDAKLSAVEKANIKAIRALEKR